jgi:polysaccharide export outer membrane protein
MVRNKFSYVSHLVLLSLICLLGSLCAPVAFAQQAQTAANVPSPTASGAEGRGENANDYRIGPGDVLAIEVAGEPELKRKVKVAQQGTIELPYIDHSIKLAGLTEQQATELLRKEFVAILKEPQVTIFIEEYHARMVSIAGAVNQPKQIALTRELRIYDLISLAGGMTDKADNVIQLVRFRPAETMEVINLNDLVRKPELNRVLRDGDFINVPESGVIYVTGNVNKPGAFPLKETVKLSQAIAMAGGPMQDSKKKEIHLVRSGGPDQTDTKEIIVNLLEIEKDASKDIILKPYDVVMVPESTRAKQTRTILQTFAGGVASALGWGILR